MLKWQMPEHLTVVNVNVTGINSENVPSVLQDLKAYVSQSMNNRFGLPIKIADEELSSGGLFSKTITPALMISSQNNHEYADICVSFRSTGSILTIKAGQHGSVSSAMRRLNEAEAAGPLSIKGGIKKAMTNKGAVEEEALYYSVVIQAINEYIDSISRELTNT